MQPEKEQSTEPTAPVKPQEVHHAPSTAVMTPTVLVQKNQKIGFAKTLAIVFIAVLLSAGASWLVVYFHPGIASTNLTLEQGSKVIESESNAVREIASTVGKSTVSITTESTTTGRNGVPSTSGGSGTGIIISKDGYVLTNKHVVPTGSDTISVILADGTKYTKVSVVGRDSLNDIAFLKIDGVDDLPVAKIGDSSLTKVGDKVVAVGNALGQYQNSVTTGIISGLGRPVTASGADSEDGTEQLENLFQTDAAINPGNSGGPLVNMKGEVIGMNTAIVADAQSIGFSIPINDAKGLIKSVLASGKLSRPYLGVRYVMLTPDTAKEENLKVEEGAYILESTSGASSVISGGPADKAGLKDGDVITKINDVTLDSLHSLQSTIAGFSVGEKIKVAYIRDGKAATVEATLQEAPAN